MECRRQPSDREAPIRFSAICFPARRTPGGPPPLSDDMIRSSTSHTGQSDPRPSRSSHSPSTVQTTSLSLGQSAGTVTLNAHG